MAVMIGCCPGLYRVVKSIISPSKASYQYNSYNARGRGLSDMPSHRSGGLNIALMDISGKDGVFQSGEGWSLSVCQRLPFLESFEQSRAVGTWEWSRGDPH
jgi:hypothetical protein